MLIAANARPSAVPFLHKEITPNILTKSIRFAFIRNKSFGNVDNNICHWVGLQVMILGPELTNQPKAISASAVGEILWTGLDSNCAVRNCLVDVVQNIDGACAPG